MTLVRLRQELSEEDLAFRMKVSQSPVSRIVTTWISFLSRELSPLIHWPTREETKSYYPECFKSYPLHRSIHSMPIPGGSSGLDILQLQEHQHMENTGKTVMLTR